MLKLYEFGHQRIQFRGDVHALRAIAILFVVLFHLDVPAFSGGFVGVDVFFVISGFVIFRKIISDCQIGRFSALGFYRQRFFRIFPSLLITIILTIVVGYILLTPDELSNLGGSALASAFSVANIYFADRLGYFAPATITTPLIHFWSLGVEEQFYLFAPLLAGFTLTRGHLRRFLVFILVLSLLSFLSNLFLVYIRFDNARAFYHPYSRFWEIGVGGAVAIFEIRWRLTPMASALAAGIGLIGILWSGLLITANDRFPGFIGLVPVLATALFIAASVNSRTWLFGLLGARIVRFFADISYSLYLVHWPIIAYWRLLTGGEFSLLSQLTMFAASVLLAALLRVAVEQYFIKAGHGDHWRRAIALLGGTLAVVALSAVLLVTQQGAPSRLNREARRIYDFAESVKRRELDCPRLADRAFPKRASALECGGEGRRPSYLLVGDSHASMLANALADSLDQSKIGGLVVTLADCQMLTGTITLKPKNRDACEALRAEVTRTVSERAIGVVILANRWANIVSKIPAPSDGIVSKSLFDSENGDRPIEFEAALLRTIDTIERAGAKVILVGPVPEIGFDVPSTLIRHAQFGTAPPEWNRAAFDARESIILSGFAVAEKDPAVSVVYPHKILCDDKLCAIAKNGLPIYSDSNHLNQLGARLITGEITALVEKAQKPAN